MRLLALDTSGARATLALLEDGLVRGALDGQVTTHSEQLLPMIDRLLHETGTRVAALEAIACGAGPGSFTGLRIGLSTAKGLCFATGARLVLISSLAALAREGAPGPLLVPVHEARRDEVYAGFYRLAGAGGRSAPVAVHPEEALAPGDLPARLAALDPGGGERWLFGEGARRHQELLEPLLDAASRLRADLPGSPRAAQVGLLALERLRAGEADDLRSAVPTYLRAPLLGDPAQPKGTKRVP